MSSFSSPSFNEFLPSRAPESGFARFLGGITDVCLYIIVAFVPLWFLPVTIDVLELNKQTGLVVLVLIALVTWVGHGLLTQSFSLTRSWLHLIVLVFLAGYGITSWFSQDRYLSFVGNVGQVQWAFVTVVALVLFYFLVANRLRNRAKAYYLILWFIFGSVFVGLYGILQLLGLYVFGGSTANIAFNTIGTVNALGVFLVAPLILAASLTVLGCQEQTCVLAQANKASRFWKGVLWAMIAVGIIIAVMIDYWVVWAGLLFGSALVVGIPFLRSRRFHRPVMLVVPGVFAALSVAFLLFQSPVPVQIPTEVAPSARHTWDIARQTLRDMPLFGSGPGTWMSDYARYRSVDANTSPFWNVRFERGISAVLTLVAMLGVVGMAILALLFVSVLSQSVVHLVREKNDDAWQVYFTVFVGWVTIVFLAFFYNYNISHQLIFWFLLALLGALTARDGWSWNRSRSPGAVTALSVLFVVLAISAVATVWLAGQRYMADVRYAQAVRSFQAQEPISQSVELLTRAVSLNPLVDSYYRSLSQAHLVSASGLLTAGLEGDAERQVQANISAAVTRAAQAIQVSPTNVDNWANAANVYEALANVMPDADLEAITRYQEALVREPNNPAFMNGIGKLFVFRADLSGQVLQSPDETARTKAAADVQTALQNAEVWFTRAIGVKADYAPAHFNLGIVYDRQGRTEEAITKLEQTLATSNQDVGIAFQLATVYDRAGQSEKAVALLENIVNVAPDYANARWVLAGLYERASRFDDAIAQIQVIVDANPGSPEVTARLQALQDAKNGVTTPPETVPTVVPEDITSNPPEANPLP